jgi:hypothetical protein
MNNELDPFAPAADDSPRRRQRLAPASGAALLATTAPLDGALGVVKWPEEAGD